MEKLLAFLKDAGTFFYASCDGDKPRVRPFGFFMELNGKFYVGMGQQKESYKQTIANPNVELCAMNKKMQWIRVRGVAVPDDSYRNEEVGDSHERHNSRAHLGYAVNASEYY